MHRKTYCFHYEASTSELNSTKIEKISIIETLIKTSIGGDFLTIAKKLSITWEFLMKK